MDEYFNFDKIKDSRITVFLWVCYAALYRFYISIYYFKYWNVYS